MVGRWIKRGDEICQSRVKLKRTAIVCLLALGGGRAEVGEVGKGSRDLNESEK